MNSTGGGRVWPLSGFWSWSEYLTPLVCAIPESCPGTWPLLNAPISTVSFSTNTQICTEAYTGPICSSCSDGFYQLNGRCYLCGSSVNQARTIYLTAIVGLVAIAVLSLG